MNDFFSVREFSCNFEKILMGNGGVSHTLLFIADIDSICE